MHISVAHYHSYGRKWFNTPRFLAIGIFLTFLVISGITALLLQYQFRELKNQALASDRVMTNLLSDIIVEHERAAIGILQSYASRPLFVNAAKRKDVDKVHRNLQDLKKSNTEIDLTFVADKNGICWANYPVFPEALGKDLSARDWYKGVKSHWKPYVSDVFKLIFGNQLLAVAAAVPVFDLEGQVTGILGTSQRLTFLDDIFVQLPLDSYSTVTIIDRMGNIVHSNRPYSAEKVTGYQFLSSVKRALEEGKNQLEIQESPQSDRTLCLTIKPITPVGWTVIAEHTTNGILRSGYRQFATTATMSLLLFAIISLFLLYVRKHILFIDSEARFRAAAAANLDAFFIFRSVRDEKGQITDFEFVDLNKSAENMIRTSKEKMIGQKLCEVTPINRTAGFFDKYVHVVETGETLDEEFPITAEQIQASWIHHQVVPLADGVAVISRDITPRKRAEQETKELNRDLRQQASQLEAANKELEAFSYSVSHDLRAPLRGIDGWSLALLEDYGKNLDDKAHEYINRVRAETHHMGQLIDDMLKLSKVTRVGMRVVPIDLTALAQGIAVRLQDRAPNREIEFIIAPALKTNGDDRLLTIALSNLLDNAVKFTGTRPHARIEFGLAKADGSPVFFVRDNGVGFDMAYASKLFGTFQRLHKSSEFPGTGIGLATVQRVVHRHGGRVWADAQVDGGATFYFSLKEAV